MWVYVLVGGSVLGIYALGWWVSNAMVWWGRWGFRLALLALLAGLTLPADVINQIIVFVSHFLPSLGEISDEPGASFGMHFFLFLCVAPALFVFRSDLPTLPLLLSLTALAFVTEGLQIPIPGRYGDMADVGTNLIGVGLGLVARWLMISIRPSVKGF